MDTYNFILLDLKDLVRFNIDLLNYFLVNFTLLWKAAFYETDVSK